jgi:hypothetical protein
MAYKYQTWIKVSGSDKAQPCDSRVEVATKFYINRPSFLKDLSRESLLKGKAKYSLPPCTN